MKKDKKLKRIVMGGVGFAMAVVVFFVGSMHSMQEVAADIRVFDKITEKYPNSDKFSMNILEIVPEGKEVNLDQNTKMNSSAEFGYFLPWQNRTTTPTQTSYGTALAAPITERDEVNFPNTLYQLRTYGMIKPFGADSVGQYPIYALGNADAGMPVFSEFSNNYCKYAFKQSFEKGVYSIEPGEYDIADGYTIDDEGRICKIEEETVSSNTTSGNSVSDNEPETIEVYVPVDDIDGAKLALPTSNTGFEYITYVGSTEDGTPLGGVKFTIPDTVTDKMQYYGHTDNTLYYLSGGNSGNVYFHNASFFREYVLGSRKKYKDRNITYNVVQASKVTVEQVQKADLIYISGKAVLFGAAEANDITEAVMLEIYNKEVNEHKAVMMDYACYSSDVDTNVSKLAVLLWRESQSEIRSTYGSYYTANTDLLSSVGFMKGDELKKLKESMVSGVNGNFVTGNVYVYNHHMSDFDDPKSMIDAGDMFANGDFNTAYKTSVAQKAFGAVLNYITATNKNSITGQMPPVVTPAVVIQYILISDGNPLTVVKTSLDVLEIQPVTEFLYNDERGSEEYAELDADTKKNRDDFIKNYLGDYYTKKGDYITFTSMSIDEFNGHNEDLVETYDIIYIGSETGDLYYLSDLTTVIPEKGVYGTTTGTMSLPTYNDAKMNGMVYYNIGDKVVVKNRRPAKVDLFGHLDNDDDSTEEKKAKTYEMRFNGRDLTADKLRKMKLFLESDALVLVEGDLMATNSSNVLEINPTAVTSNETETTYDRGRIDTSSKMYELFMYAQGFIFDNSDGTYKNASNNQLYEQCHNFVSVADIKSGAVERADIDQYIAAEKLDLTMTTVPREYAYSTLPNSEVIDPDTIVYMEEEKDGTRRLTYDFIISSQSVSEEVNTLYIPSLYIDVNKDGKYSTTTEIVRDMQVVVKETGAEADRDENNNYLLYKNVEYRMIRDLDEEFSGYLQWKINIQARGEGNANIHTSVEGSTVVKNKGENKKIKILQIEKDAGTLNLQTESTKADSLFAQHLKAVPGYDVYFVTMKASDYVKNFQTYYGQQPKETSVEECAMGYFNSIIFDEGSDTTTQDDIKGANMIVFGYGDMFESFTDDNAVKALKVFIDNEKPVLMAHDFMHYDATHSQTAILRNQLGADKYGVTLDIFADKENNFEKLVPKRIDNSGLDYLHSGSEYTRSKNKTEMTLIESTGKTVAYQPSFKMETAREMTVKNTQGITNYSIEAFQYNTDTKTWINSPKAALGNADLAVGRGSYVAEKINQGQITNYPYLLPDSFSVEQTHAQHLALDLDADDDNDGETDVVVWYALGAKSPASNGYNTSYDAYANDAGGPMPADGYYVYNKGNITYTGFGDAKEAKFTADEAQLFVNTLFAAFNADQVGPKVSFYEEIPDAYDLPVTGITVPYDENIVDDASILKKADGSYKYQFVNPNATSTALKAGADVSTATPVYYRLSDANFVRGKKYMTVHYYLKPEGERYDEANGTYKLDGVTNPVPVEQIEIEEGAVVPLVDITDYLLTYQAGQTGFVSEVHPDSTTGELSFMESGITYGFYLPMSYLNDSARFTVYVRTKTRVITQSSQGGGDIETTIPEESFAEFTVTKADLLNLD